MPKRRTLCDGFLNFDLRNKLTSFYVFSPAFYPNRATSRPATWGWLNVYDIYLKTYLIGQNYSRRLWVQRWKLRAFQRYAYPLRVGFLNIP